MIEIEESRSQTQNFQVLNLSRSYGVDQVGSS